MSKLNKQDVAEHFAAERIVPINEAEVPPQIWILRADIEDDCLAGASLFTEKPRGESVEYVPASALESFRRRAIEAVRALETEWRCMFRDPTCYSAADQIADRLQSLPAISEEVGHE